MDGICEILNHLYNNDLRKTPEDHKLLITEPPNNDSKIREELVKRLFEEYKVPKLYLGNQAVMSLFATGRTTGTVVDAGYGITHTVPIYEGFAIPHATTEVSLCGQGLTEFMVQLWQEKANARGWQVELGAEDLAEAEIFKIKYSRVASDYDAELKSANEGNGASIEYKLPDGNMITVREELIRIPEMLFQPGL